MTNTLALALGALLLLAALADGFFNGGGATFFLARKTVGLIEWVAFWR